MINLKNRWGWTFGIIFVIISLYAITNRGDLPSIFVEETEFGGDTTFLGKILIFIVFPFAMLGMTIEGLVSDNVFLLLVILIEFAFGFIIGSIIHWIYRRVK